MRTIIFTALAQILHLHLSYAQGKEDYTWILGSAGSEGLYGGMTINFSNATPTIQNTFPLYVNMDGSSSCSDQDGKLLLYSDGCSIYDKYHQIILNGDHLSGEIGSGDCTPLPSGVEGFGNYCLLLPMPGKENLYKLFHYNGTNGTVPPVLKLMLSTIDMGKNNGSGEVVEKKVFILQDTLNDLLTAVKHANGIDWWVVLHKWNTTTYYVGLLDSTGISPFQTQVIPGGLRMRSGQQQQSGFSPDGLKLVQTAAYQAQLLDFDRCRGLLSNPQIIYNDLIFRPNGVAFSNDSRFLYILGENQSEIFQYELQNFSTSNKVKIGQYDGFVDPETSGPAVFGDMLTGPDGKIYIFSPGTRYLHVIRNPEKKGTSCNLVQHSITLPRLHYGNAPNLPHFRTPTQVPACDQLVYDSSYCNCRDTLPIARKLSIYPNPALEYVEVSGPPGTEVPLSVEIYDALGRLLIQQHFTCLPGRVSLGGLPAAGYFYRIVGADGKAVQESTLVKVNR